MLNILDETALRCPFCMKTIPETNANVTYDNVSYFEGGRCQCGAVYAFDQSGHNLGQAYEDALYYACNGDLDLAWSLDPDEDYKQIVVNTHENQRVSVRTARLRGTVRDRKKGFYYFLKLLKS
jgi:hypothetical protein